jgi:four helix bundle protein
MATVQKFEDLEVWKQARILNKEIHGVTCLSEFSKDYSLKDQIRRSSGSVMDNIAEGFERNGNKEFIQFLYIAKGSNGEIRSQLYRAFDFGYLDQIKFDELYKMSNQIGALVYKLVQYLKSSEMKGNKFK